MFIAKFEKRAYHKCHAIEHDAKAFTCMSYSHKLLRYFHRIWQLAAAIRAEQCVLTVSTSPDVCVHTHTHYCNCDVMRDRIVTKKN